MLKEIFCEEFKEHGKIREPITFDKGLNVVIGVRKEGKENSIGKTSILLVVDFCFGGKSYLDSKVVKVLGRHQIFFTFLFDKPYYFCRSTEKEDDLYKCDELRNVQDQISIEVFKKWLAEKYLLTNVTNDVRDVISPYFRIYNKSISDAKAFLQSHNGQSQGEQVRNFQKLFDGYSSIRQFAEKVDLYEAKKNVLTQARRKKVDLIELQEKESIKDLKSKLEEIECREKDLLGKKSDEVLCLDKKNTEILLQIKTDLRRLRSRKSVLEMRLRNIASNLNNEIFEENTFEALLDFFPNANIRLLKEIENFHSKFSVSLQSDFDEFVNATQIEIENLNNQIQQKMMELSKYEDYGDFSVPFLKTYSALQIEKNECFKKISAVNDEEAQSKEVRKCKKVLKPLEEHLMADIKSSLNSCLDEFSRIVFAGEELLVKIDFPTMKKAVLDTEYDDGTGTDFSEMLMFDLALLQKTHLPAIVHDSFWFSNIRGNRIEKILKLYETFAEKQIFISIDEIDKYGSDIQKMLRNKKVLLLETDGGELYGRSFPKEIKNKHKLL